MDDGKVLGASRDDRHVRSCDQYQTIREVRPPTCTGGGSQPITTATQTLIWICDFAGGKNWKEACFLWTSSGGARTAEGPPRTSNPSPEVSNINVKVYGPGGFALLWYVWALGYTMEFINSTAFANSQKPDL